ncbi:MAG: c-type cytochrome [Myxococcota bacterium]|nr:c-type cytochrome [Myxococcota bacterium]
MKRVPHPYRRRVLWLLMLMAIACSDAPIVADDGRTLDELAFPGPENGKVDVFGRALVGLADPYPADPNVSSFESELQRDMKLRRELGWAVAERVLENVPLFGLEMVEPGRPLEIEGGIPEVPRWQTWYGVDDFRRIFRRLFNGLTDAERRRRAPFSESSIEDALDWNVKARERSARWPLERFFKHVSELAQCESDLSDADCARSLQSNFSGAATGNARITYSPATLKHLIKNYQNNLDCLPELAELTLDAQSMTSDLNFTACLGDEFPISSVLIKAQWARANFGRAVDVFDTDAESLQGVIGPDKSAHWATPSRRATPSADEIYTIRTRTGDLYRLVGLHIMTKELRHWVWVTLWWSDTPESDFGADRPASLTRNADSVWNNYKMTVVVDYEERDPDVTSGLEAFPSLQDALAVQSSALTWASNPYIEHGRGNARTNCIGCHQHGGSTVAFDLNNDGRLDALDLDRIISDETLYPLNGRTKQRTIFPTDYLWTTQRVDNLRQLMLTEVRHFDDLERQKYNQRILDINDLSNEVESGTTVFETYCTACHGSDGSGTTDGPDLATRNVIRTKQDLIRLLLTGVGNMPAWDGLTDQELADLVAYLQASFVVNSGQ